VSERPGDPAATPRRRPWSRRLILIGAGLLGAVLLFGAAAGVWLGFHLRASLPQLEGDRVLIGLRASVTIYRDAFGVPTVRGRDRLDVARATGFLHAQDRFFQMDLLRRQAAGELAELLGPALLDTDRANRLHRFRAAARRAVSAADEERAALITAYSEGVNAGLAALGTAPFEYLLLRDDPTPWRPEDSVLVILAMFFELQDEDGSRESSLGVMHDVLPPELFDFLTPPGTSWDAPLTGEPFAVPPTPGPEVIDLRATGRDDRKARIAPAAPGRMARAALDRAVRPGSNNWAVAGSATANGGALLAGDMHLGLQMPNIWYRVSFTWTGDDGTNRVATGVTLPGIYALIVGSNGRVAWAFTNSYGDWSDLVVIEVDPDDPESYRTPDGVRRFERSQEMIRVKGQPDEMIEVVSTLWGPLVDVDYHGRPRALRWLAHDVEAVNLDMRRLEDADDLDEALHLAGRSGAPAQNFVCADSTGRIGWTILGIMPRRIGFDGRLPASWADGTRRWDGWLESSEYPRIVDPPQERIWTANARVVDGEMLRLIGDGGYDLGARAGQIRDGLLAIERASPADMLRIQLDDRALFHQRWRDLLLEVLSPDAITGRPLRAELRRLVEDWGGRATTAAAGFRMVRAWRLFLAEKVFAALTAPCLEADERFSYDWYEQREGPLWRLVTERPLHLLDPEYGAWDEMFLAVVDHTIDYFTAEREDGAIPLAEQTWGRRNTLRMQHPISMAIPALGRWLDIPAKPLPGASLMPRVQGPTFGASQRMAVSPGREAEGYFHMPGGQSGHPLSPYYRAGHDAWEEGRPAPFLPGATVHTLTLTPQ
jgi:penicillin amidase